MNKPHEVFELLGRIASPADLRALERRDLPQLCNELREFLLQSVSRTGGHLSSNLGTVELTVALHYVFNTPDDRLVWDVGHQTYAHKVLTGRREGMDRLVELLIEKETLDGDEFRAIVAEFADIPEKERFSPLLAAKV